MQLEKLEDELIGAIVADSSFYFKIRDRVFREAFSDPKNKKLYDVFEHLADEKESIDSTSVYITARKLFKDSFEDITSHAFNCETHRQYGVNYDMLLSSLANDYISKELARLNTKFSQWLLEGKYSPEEAVTKLRKAQDKLLSLNVKNEISKIGDLVKNFVERIEKSEDEDSESGVRFETGLKFWDEHVGQFKGGKLIVLAARPGMGKTALGTKVAYKVAEQKIPSAILSYEMTSDELVERIVAPIARVNTRRISDYSFSKPEKERLLNILETEKSIKDMPLYLEDASSPHIDTVITRIILLANMGVKVFVVDQTSQIKGEGKEKRERVGDISGKLKGVAKMMNVDVILLNQIGRDVEKRGGEPIPVLSDLKESGNLEEDADIVVFIYRPEYYNRMEDAEGNSTEGKAMVIVAKNRGIGTSEVKCRYIKWYTDFRDLEEGNRIEIEETQDDGDIPF